jgi:hypothetical protein
MEDFRIKTSWRTSRKRRRLKRLLGADGVLAIEDLWSYCSAERESGDLAGMSNEDIADEVAWEGDADELVSGFVACGLLDGEPGAFKIHDWEDHNPYVATGEARSETAAYKAHLRWHVRRGETKEGCVWCDGAEAPVGCGNAPAHADSCSGNAPASSGNTNDANGNAPPLPPTSLPTKERSRAREVSDAVHEVRNRAAAECGLSTPGSETEKAIARLVPFKAGAVDYAMEQTAKADNPNWTYLLKCLKNPSPRSRGSPDKPRDPAYGYHPPSKEFGDGFQEL